MIRGTTGLEPSCNRGGKKVGIFRDIGYFVSLSARGMSRKTPDPAEIVAHYFTAVGSVLRRNYDMRSSGARVNSRTHSASTWILFSETSP